MTLAHHAINPPSYLDPFAKLNMSLLALPDETLTYIVHELGSSFFKEDLGRLTICKRWHAIAQAQIATHVILGLKNVVFLFRQVQQQQSATLDLPTWAKHGTKTLKVDVEGEVCPYHHPREERDLGSYFRDTFDELLHYPPEHWILHYLGKPDCRRSFRPLEQLQRLGKLEVRLSVRDNEPPMTTAPPCGKAAHRLFDQFAKLRLPTLRELDINIPADGAFRHLAMAFGASYTCESINLLLHRLRTLKLCHLRLAFACRRIFDTRQAEGALELESLHVRCENTNWCDGPPYNDLRDVDPDDVYNGRHFPQARDDLASSIIRQMRANKEAFNMTVAAGVLSRAMKAPKEIRIMWRDIPSEVALRDGFVGMDADQLRVFAWDVLSNEVRVLLRSEDCHNDGQIISLGEELHHWRPGKGQQADGKREDVDAAGNG